MSYTTCALQVGCAAGGYCGADTAGGYSGGGNSFWYARDTRGGQSTANGQSRVYGLRADGDLFLYCNRGRATWHLSLTLSDCEGEGRERETSFKLSYGNSMPARHT